MKFIRKNSLHIHRIFYGCASSIITVAAPIYIYNATQNIVLAAIFLLAKYIVCTLVSVLSKNIIHNNPIIGIGIHILLLCLANIMLLTLPMDTFFVIILAVCFALAEVFYIISFNIIFGVRIHDSLATLIQFPYILGVMFVGAIRYGFAVKLNLAYWVIAVAVLLHIVSLLPLIVDTQVLRLHNYMREKEVVKPYRNIKRDMYHASLGLFNSVIFEIIPLYLIFTSKSVVLTLLPFLFIEVLKLISSKSGELLYKKGLYNFVMVSTSICNITALALMAIFNESEISYYLYILVSVLFPMNFIPKFSSYVAAIRRENRVHYNQTRREVFMSVSKILAPAMFLLTGSFIYVIILGVLASIGLLVFSYNYSKEPRITYKPAEELIV